MSSDTHLPEVRTKKRYFRPQRRTTGQAGLISSLHPHRTVPVEPGQGERTAPLEEAGCDAENSRGLAQALLQVRQELAEAQRCERRARAEMQGLLRERSELEQSLQANRSLVARFLRERQKPPASPRELELESLCEGLRLQVLAHEHESLVSELEKESLRAQWLQLRLELDESRQTVCRLQEQQAQQLHEHEFLVGDLQTEVVRLYTDSQQLELALQLSHQRLEQLVETQDNLLVALEDSRLEMVKLRQQLSALQSHNG